MSQEAIQKLIFEYKRRVTELEIKEKKHVTKDMELLAALNNGTKMTYLVVIHDLEQLLK